MAVIHEWTYEAMAHDLLDTGTNGQSGGGGGGPHNGLLCGVMTFEVETQGGEWWPRAAASVVA